MKIELFEHQKEQIKLGLEGKNINQSQAGSGKTFVGLEIFKQSKYKKLLVIGLAPKVQDFHEDGKLVDLVIEPLNKGTAKNKKLIKDNYALAISFESSWRLTELLSWVDKDTMLLIDESHKAKSPTSKVSAFMEKVASKCGYTYIMSATLVSNGKYEDYYQQLKIAGHFKGNFKDFKKEYCIEELQEMKVGGQTRYFNTIVDYKNTDKLDKLVSINSVYAERNKPYLPEDIIYLTKKPTMYGRVYKNRVVELPNGETILYDNLPKLRHALLQLASGVLTGIDKPLNKDKLDRVSQILDQHNNERVVIFYNYDVELNVLKDLLKSMKIPTSEYNGHKKDLRNFKQYYNGVVLVHYKSGATGINDLVIANTTIYFSMTQSSTNYIQSKARTDRHGQTNKPLYYHLICDKTIEVDTYGTVSKGEDFTNESLKAILNLLG